MRAGLLKEKLTFLDAVTTITPSGAPVKQWNPVYSCRAYKRRTTTSIGDGINAKEVFVNYNLVFQVRYNPLISDSQRVEYRGRTYKIVPPLDYRQDNTYIITLNRVDP